MQDAKQGAKIKGSMENDNFFMQMALAEAQKACALGEIPIGAVVVRGGQVVGKGYNCNETNKDPSCHAEILAIKEACKALGGWRLPGCTLYVTVEPCSMCAGAIVLARIERLVIGTDNPKAGACGSLYNIVEDERLNHRVSVTRGVLKDECSSMLKDFFAMLRNNKE